MKYTCSYQHGRGRSVVHIHADSMAEAESRVESIKQNIHVDGELSEEIPYWVPTWIAFQWISFKEWYQR